MYDACKAGECRIPECCGGFVPATCARIGCKAVVGMAGDVCTEHELCDGDGCGEWLTLEQFAQGLCNDCSPEARQERADLEHDRITSR
jgi:hypothetical protein